MTRRLVWCIAGLSLGAVAARSFAQAPPPPPPPGETKEEPPVSVKAYADADRVRPGDSFRIAIVLEVKKGFHVYGIDQKGDDVTRTSVKPPKTVGIEWQAPAYPKSIEKKIAGEAFHLYEGEVKIVLRGKAGEGLAPGSLEIPFEVAYQACTDEYCLEPRPKEIAKLKLQVGKAGDPVQPCNAEIFEGKKPAGSPPKHDKSDGKE
jgi:hypothetical protein